jgi:hypothetical protein
LVLLTLLCSSLAVGAAREVDEYHWEGVDRIVAIGDLHGDYENYLATLQAAGLADSRGKWTGGSTHLVQTGDIPDRGPDTGRIIEHIIKLDKQARRKGGRVHNLIGNHEAMNVYGDLRYVHEGEYEAFVTRKSENLRDRWFEIYLQRLEESDPERFAALPADFRERWNMEFPLGWVEHRQAWNPDGDYGKWVLQNKVAVQINDVLFLHGGISGFYCGNSLEWMTENVRQKLRNFVPGSAGILEDDFGPLWYRGLSGVEPVAAPETVDAILARHDASHIVVGHTPTSGVIWPLYDGKVVMIDTGIAGAYGGYLGYLEVTASGLSGGYAAGKLALPGPDEERIGYLERVIALAPGNPHLKQRLERLLQPAPQQPPETAAEAGQAASGEAEAAGGVEPEAAQPASPEIPICGTAR